MSHGPQKKKPRENAQQMNRWKFHVKRRNKKNEVFLKNTVYANYIGPSVVTDAN